MKAILTTLVVVFLFGFSLPSPAVGFSDADANALVGKLVQALNTRDAKLLRSIYHDALRMSICNGFDRLVANVVFGDWSDVTLENLTPNSVSLTVAPKIAGVASSGRTPVIFGVRFAFAGDEGLSGEITVAVRWEVGSVGGAWRVMRQYSAPCDVT